MPWTKEQVEAIRRNEAIKGHNRLLVDQALLGLEFKPMELEPIPPAPRPQDADQ